MQWRKEWKPLSHTTYLQHHPLLKWKFDMIHALSVPPSKPFTVNTGLNASTLLVPACDPLRTSQGAAYAKMIPTCTFSCLHAHMRLGDANIWVFPSHFHFWGQTTFQSNYSTEDNLEQGARKRKNKVHIQGRGTFLWYGGRVEGRDSCNDVTAANSRR